MCLIIPVLIKYLVIRPLFIGVMDGMLDERTTFLIDTHKANEGMHD